MNHTDRPMFLKGSGALVVSAVAATAPLACRSTAKLDYPKDGKGALGFEGSTEGHPAGGVRDVRHERRCRRAHAVPRGRMAARSKGTGDGAG
jgi:hypothetical protein